MTSETLPSDAAPAKKKRPLALLLISFRTFIALIVVFAFFGLTTPNFLDLPTLVILAQHVAINAIMAIGMTFVILTAGIDLSVGSIVGVSGMIAGLLLTQGIPVPPLGVTIFPNVVETMLITLAAGALIGLINGLLITRLNVAPFIATLGMLYVARGAALLISGGSTFSNLVGDPKFGNTGFPFLGSGRILGMPASIVALVVFCVGRGLCRGAYSFRTLRVRGRRQRPRGGSVRSAGQPRDGVRIHDLGLLRGVRRAHRRL